MTEEKNYYAHETAQIDAGANIGTNSKIWHFSHVMSGAQIGQNCVLGQNSYVGAKAVIGNGVKIQNNVSIYDNVIIDDDVFCGPSCVFTNVVNPRSFVERKSEYLNTHIKKGVTIGANATIVCGVTIGEYAFIGAGAVVTKDLKAYGLYTGVPAVRKGWVSRAGVVLKEDLLCLESGEKYYLENDELKLAYGTER